MNKQNVQHRVNPKQAMNSVWQWDVHVDSMTVTNAPSGAPGWCGGRLDWGVGKCGNSALFPQFCCEPKTSLKYNLSNFFKSVSGRKCWTGRDCYSLSLPEEILESALEGGKGLRFGEKSMSPTRKWQFRASRDQTDRTFQVRLRRLISLLRAGRSQGRFGVWSYKTRTI